MVKKQSELNNVCVHRLGHVAIRVDDLDRAKSFYISLGMKLIWDDPDWCYLETETTKDGLALLGPGYKAAGPHFAFHFTIDDDSHNCRVASGARYGREVAWAQEPAAPARPSGGVGEAATGFREKAGWLS